MNDSPADGWERSVIEVWLMIGFQRGSSLHAGYATFVACRNKWISSMEGSCHGYLWVCVSAGREQLSWNPLARRHSKFVPDVRPVVNIREAGSYQGVGKACRSGLAVPSPMSRTTFKCLAKVDVDELIDNVRSMSASPIDPLKCLTNQFLVTV